MKVATLAFRFRLFIFLVLYLLGFLPPWDWSLHYRGPGTLWLAASTLFARSGWIGLAAATVAVTSAALACLALGTMCAGVGRPRTSAHGVMRDSAMRDDQFVAAGPYRYVRNPLYLGSWLLAGGASILMPPSGAAFFLLAFSVFVLFLISAEERFLSAKLGDVYQQYRRRVPRLLPRLGAGDGASGADARTGCRLFLPRPIRLPLRFASRSSPGATMRASSSSVC